MNLERAATKGAARFQLLGPCLGFALVCLLTLFALLAWRATSSQQLENGALITEIEQGGYALAGTSDPDETKRQSLRIEVAPAIARNLSLIVYRAEDLTIFNEGLSESDRRREGYWNLQTIPLDDPALYDEETQEFELSWETANSLLPYAMFLEETDRFQASLDVYESVMLVLIGAFLMLLVYCLSLYAFKRSESYLLYFSAYLAATLASTLLRIDLISFSIIPAFSASTTASFFAGAQMLSAVGMSCRLFNVMPPGRLALLVSWPGILLGSLLYYTVSSLTGTHATESVRFALLMLCATPLICAWAQRTSGAAVLTIFYAFKTGIAVTTILANFGVIGNWLGFILIRPLCFLDLPFIPACMVVVNYYFARKFNEAEMLGIELFKLNDSLDQQVKNRTKELVEQQERRHNMMLNIFHDLRSPIFTVQGCLELVESDPAANRDLIEVARERTRFLSSLTEDLFLLAKLETRELAVPFEKVDLGEVLSAAIASQRVVASRKEVVLRCQGITCCPVWGNRDHLERMVQNVLANSVYYTPSGKEVSIRLDRTKDRVRVDIADQGSGITEEELTHIFERYYRAEKGKTTGLGLAIASNIASLHHGSIYAHSTLGEGSVFTINLPVLTDRSKPHGTSTSKDYSAKRGDGTGPRSYTEE